jgi:membrane protein required for colicin V production
MSWLDIILIVVLVTCMWRGFSAGLIKTVGSFFGIIGGAFLASHFYEQLFQLIKNWFGGLDNIGRVVCFIVLFIIASRIIFMLFVLLDKTYNLLSIIPFLKSVNHISGGLLGLLVGVAAMGLLIYAVAKFTPAQSFFGNVLTQSKIAPYLLDAAKIFLPILSGSLKDLKSIL